MSVFKKKDNPEDGADAALPQEQALSPEQLDAVSGGGVGDDSIIVDVQYSASTSSMPPSPEPLSIPNVTPSKTISFAIMSDGPVDDDRFETVNEAGFKTVIVERYSS